MGIDRIGKSGPHAATPTTSREAPRAAQTGRPFEAPEAARAAPSSAVEAPSGALGELQAGALDINGYVDRKVEEATAHLVGMPAHELVGIRAALRDRLVHDPTLVDLVRTATGGVPSLPDDE